MKTRNHLQLFVSICVIGLGIGCMNTSNSSNGEAYQNEKQEDSAVIYERKSGRWGGGYAHVSIAEVHKIDGKVLLDSDVDPVYVEPGEHAVVFRFQVSSKPGTPFFDEVGVAFKPNTIYRIRTDVDEDPEAHIEFRLYEEDEVVHTNFIPIPKEYAQSSW